MTLEGKRWDSSAVTTILGGNMANVGSVLISGGELKQVLEQAVKKCRKNLVFISAYITQAAVDWLYAHVPNHVKVHLVCRLTPSDVVSGSTDISALVSALERGWNVSCLHSLHAKLYLVDNEQIYVGSANLTNNGLKIYGKGNIEACVSVSTSKENLLFISSIEESANSLNHGILQKMENYINDKKNVIYSNVWPEDVIPNKEGIWVCDFLWYNPQSNTFQPDEKKHDLELIGVKSFDLASKEISKKVLMLRCVQWLISKLKDQEETELYFGHITSILHSELKDDPTPYRKKVKTLVQNLLVYSKIFIPETIEISNPNYSQRAKLLVTK